MYNYSPRVSTSTPFRSTASRFWDTGHFDTSAPNDPQIDLEPYKVKLPHMSYCCVHESQISLRFALWPVVFEMQPILRQGHRMTSKWPWTLQGQITPYVLLLCSRVPNFTPFCSMTNHFRDTGNFATRAPNDLEPYEVKLPYTCITSIPDSQISLFRSMTNCFRDTGHFETNALNDPKITLNTTRSYVPHIYVTTIHESQVSHVWWYSSAVQWHKAELKIKSQICISLNNLMVETIMYLFCHVCYWLNILKGAWWPRVVWFPNETRPFM